ncbi:hypothetical protein [Nisaea sp.]|uniref:hypothetical protein n=1 Tax=Nisaea sp. TaxID=2024842 RepID=UPI003B52A2FB
MRDDSKDCEALSYPLSLGRSFSLATWSMCLLLSLLWLIYAILPPLPAIYVPNGLYAAANMIMVVGINLHAGLAF